MPRPVRTIKGIWAQEAALMAACELWAAEGHLTKRAICQRLGRSPAWGSTYLGSLDHLLARVLVAEGQQAWARLARGVPVPDVLHAYWHTARELNRRGRLFRQVVVLEALQRAVGDPPWLPGALLGLLCTTPREETRGAVAELLGAFRAY